FSVCDLNVCNLGGVKRNVCMASHFSNERMVNEATSSTTRPTAQSDRDNLVVHAGLWLLKQELAPMFGQSVVRLHTHRSHEKAIGLIPFAGFSYQFLEFRRQQPVLGGADRTFSVAESVLDHCFALSFAKNEPNRRRALRHSHEIVDCVVIPGPS